MCYIVSCQSVSLHDGISRTIYFWHQSLHTFLKNTFLLLFWVGWIMQWCFVRRFCTTQWPVATFVYVRRYSTKGCTESSLIARFMGPTWGPSGADRTHVGPMSAQWTLLSGVFSNTWLNTMPTYLWVRPFSNHWSAIIDHIIEPNYHPNIHLTKFILS